MRKLTTMIATALLIISIPAAAINKEDLIDCLRGEPVDIICPE